MKQKLIFGIRSLARAQTGGILTIGNFDGVHVGHQALLKHTLATARLLQKSSLLMTFEPQPNEFFSKVGVGRLTRLREKVCLLQDKVDQICVIKFNAAFAKMSAQSFVEEILCAKLNIHQVIVGEDFRFGKGREGDISFLEQIGKKKGFLVEAFPAVFLEEERVSSTRVRKALHEGNQSLAEKLLGRPYTMQGRVVHGHKTGRALGFPTANINLKRQLSPVQGIYAVKMHGIDPKPLLGVASLGHRPTIGGTHPLLEVHLFDFDRTIYGEIVEIEFCEKLRDEACYSSLDLLKEQIQRDVDEARSYFAMRGE